ncbi:glycosyltransferase [Lichenicola sp.]|uniref:glycosyltransferase n=1 Tax=Lichenicola sp. TaxID=2804529 RepID=UPI003B00550F
MIFRNNLFRVSEPFITSQAGQLRRYVPTYVGRLRYGEPPEGARSLALRDGGRSMARIGWQMLTRNPGPYVRLLAERSPALIHAHFGIDGVYALPVARRLGVKLITTFHGYDATLSTAALLSSPAWFNYPLFRHRLARDGALFLCVSSFIRDKVLAMGFPAERTHIHYIGVDCQAIRPRSPDEERPTILHVGRLVEMKGTQYLLRAFATLAARHPELRLVIIGDGELAPSLRTLAGSLGLGERAVFLGARPHAEVLARMRQARMLVLPSVLTATGRVEGLGMVMLEAAAAGVPVVATRVGGIPEGVRDGETGFLVPERDVEALARRIEDLLNSPGLRQRMAVQARAFVEQRFDGRRQGELLERHYDALLPRAR